MSDSIEKIIDELRVWGGIGAAKIADRLAALPAAAVPDGWQLVPKEATAEMKRAALEIVGSGPIHVLIGAMFSSMLAAAPSPQATGAVVASDKQGDWLLDEVEALAHRTAWRYKKSSDPHHSDTYTFNRFALLHFAEKLRALDTSAKGDAS